MHLPVVEESLHQHHLLASKDLLQMNQIHTPTNWKKCIVRNNEKVWATKTFTDPNFGWNCSQKWCAKIYLARGPYQFHHCTHSFNSCFPLLLLFLRWCNKLTKVNYFCTKSFTSRVMWWTNSMPNSQNMQPERDKVDIYILWLRFLIRQINVKTFEAWDNAKSMRLQMRLF